MVAQHGTRGPEPTLQRPRVQRKKGEKKPLRLQNFPENSNSSKDNVTPHVYKQHSTHNALRCCENVLSKAICGRIPAQKTRLSQRKALF